MLYVGVDTHKQTTHLTVMDEVGKVLTRKQIRTSPVELYRVLQRYHEPMKAALEATYTWGPMYDWLGGIAEEVILAHPKKVRLIAEARIKTDRIDSEILAHLLRANLIPPAYAPSPATRATKRVLRQRMFFVRLRTMLKNRIHALLSQHAIVLPAVSDLYGKAGMRWLRQLTLPAPDGPILREDLALVDDLQPRLAATDQLIAELAEGDAAIGWLRSLPGLGEFLAVLVRYEIDDIQRFATPQKLMGYTGLVPSTYSSAARLVHGKLTKQGNSWLRWAFVEAVQPAVRKSPSLRRYYEQLKLRRGVKDARVATARKLVALSWYVWTEGRCYQER